MKRSELYALVWEKPVIKLAKELGVSDVGLAKACRRHGIPIPPRGHWTKLQFAKTSPQTPLPAQDQDEEVQLTIPTPREIARKEKSRALVKAVERVAEELPPPPFEISAELDKPHPLVKATNAYLQRLPKIIKRYERTNWLDRGADFESPPYAQHGRYSFKIPNGLVVTASLEKMDWVLRFYNSLFAALAQSGARAKRTDVDPPRGGPRESKVSIELAGETLSITLSEGYRKYELDAEEFRLAKLKESWAKSWRYVPSESFSQGVREEARLCLPKVVERIVVYADRIEVGFKANALSGIEDKELVWLTTPYTIKRRGLAMRLILNNETQAATPDARLLELIAKGHRWLTKLTSGASDGVGALAREEGVGTSYVTRLMYLAMLAPDIIQRIAGGEHPGDLTAERLVRMLPLPEDWGEQRRLLGME